MVVVLVVVRVVVLVVVLVVGTVVVLVPVLPEFGGAALQSRTVKEVALPDLPLYTHA